MIRTIIIDDEEAAVNVLTLLLQKVAKNHIEIIGTTNSPEEGRLLIISNKPDLIFLDIEMPGMSGIDLIRSLPDNTSQVVFVTAYDAFAIEAFELSAIDYLLKPIGSDKLEKVIQKAKNNIERNKPSFTVQFQQLERILKMQSGNEKKLAIGMADRIVFILVADIMYCEAQGNYTSVIMRDGYKHLASKTLADFEAQLVDNNFFRIHHSYLINLNRIKEFQRYDGGYVIMENSAKLDVSQRKRKDFLEAINNFII
jgi:two-component system, LytTR family, response regulator